MFCRKCGVENLADSNFCTGCGSELIAKDKPIDKKVTISEQMIVDGPYNETGDPNLLISTQLIFKDIFRYGKRMGRADYWYGMLGLAIFDAMLLLMLMILINISNVVSDIGNMLFLRTMIFLVMFTVIFMVVVTFLVTLSAQIRRLHDIAMSGAWILLKLLPLGDLILLIFTCQRSKQKDNPYITETQTKLGKILYEFRGSVVGIVIGICLLLTVIGIMMLINISNASTSNDVDDTIEYNYNIDTSDTDEY